MISVVIPTLNEALELPSTLERLLRVPEISEIIVTDGRSTDGTPEIAGKAGARLVRGDPGRGQQLRRGARIATADNVLLLHADTWVDPDLGRSVLEVLKRPNHVGGACYKAFRNPHWLMRGSRFRCWIRMYAWQFAYGDQAIFFRRTVLERMGGVPPVPLMEEYLLCREARLHGRLGLAGTTVTTSARRFQKFGVLATYKRMAYANWLWYRGVPAERILQAYEAKKSSRSA